MSGSVPLAVRCLPQGVLHDQRLDDPGGWVVASRETGHLETVAAGIDHPLKLRSNVAGPLGIVEHAVAGPVDDRPDCVAAELDRVAIHAANGEMPVLDGVVHRECFSHV